MNQQRVVLLLALMGCAGVFFVLAPRLRAYAARRYGRSRERAPWYVIVGPVVATLISIGTLFLSGAMLVVWESDGLRETLETARYAAGYHSSTAMAEETKKYLALVQELIDSGDHRLNDLVSRVRLAAEEAVDQSERDPLKAVVLQLEKVASDVGAQDARIAKQDARLAELEATILVDPIKALGMPLLRRDMEALSERNDVALSALRAENERLFDLMKTLVGLIVGVSISLVGTGLGILMKRYWAEGKARGGSSATSTV